jgi:ribosomal protein L30
MPKKAAGDEGKRTTKKATKTAAKRASAKTKSAKSKTAKSKTAKAKTAKAKSAKAKTAKPKAPRQPAAKPATVEAAATGTPRLRVRQTRSGIGRAGTYRRTLRALGLRHHQDEAVVADTASIRGMLHKVRHLVRVTPEEA